MQNNIDSEILVNVETSLVSPQTAGLPKCTRDRLSHLNFDIDGNGLVHLPDMTRSVSNMLMKFMGRKGLWQSFFNKKKECFESIKQPGCDVNFMLIIKIKNCSNLFSQMAFGMGSDDYVRAIGDSKGKVCDRFIGCGKEIHSRLSLLFGKESILLFRTVMDRETPRFFALVVPMERNRVVPFKDLDLSKEGLRKTRDLLQRDISMIVSSFI